MAVLIFKDMSKKKKNNRLNDVVKALRRAERELQLERNGYDHPWVAMTITHKNKKAYNRKRDRKNFNYNSDGLFFCYLKSTKSYDMCTSLSPYLIMFFSMFSLLWFLAYSHGHKSSILLKKSSLLLLNGEVTLL